MAQKGHICLVGMEGGGEEAGPAAVCCYLRVPTPHTVSHSSQDSQEQRSSGHSRAPTQEGDHMTLPNLPAAILVEGPTKTGLWAFFACFVWPEPGCGPNSGDLGWTEGRNLVVVGGGRLHLSTNPI